MNALVSVLITIFIMGFFLWVIKIIPILDGWVKQLMYGIVVFATIVYLLGQFGFLPGYVH